MTTYFRLEPRLRMSVDIAMASGRVQGQLYLLFGYSPF